MRQASARALGGIGRPEAAPALARALSDEDPETRFQALEALGKIPGPEATEAIRAFAEGGDHKLAPRARYLLRNR